MTLLPAGACPSRRASLPSHLHPIDQSSAISRRSGSSRLFLPISSTHSHAGLARLSSARGDDSPASDSFALGGLRDSEASSGCECATAPIPFAVDISKLSSANGSSDGGSCHCSPADSTRFKRRPSTNSKGYNVNFQKVPDEDFTLNNEVGHMSADLAHLVDRNKLAECVKAVHILERKSYENDDIQPYEDMAAAADDDDCNSSSDTRHMKADEEEGFDENLWNSIMSESDEQQQQQLLLSDRVPLCSDAAPVGCCDWQQSGRRSTHPNASSLSSSFQHIKRVKADANEHCHRVIYADN
ncbi:hypothetical protein FOL47_001291 [Perkinsus chesapeaki]|uniref:Uncharacterized protein n=1 Tax=Perkinsus chesapeaki TaxID=330153 RepID=A0A7J6N165_PERCH|nr:hypothetical protein FOL47_001291 [Perkinsus chesapeaki]